MPEFFVGDMPTEEVKFQNKKAHFLKGTLRYPAALDESYPAVIVLHEFSSRSNHEFIVNIANFILPYRYVVLRFDFHGHGDSEGDFSDLTITQQVDDVISAINFLETLPFVNGNIGVVGHGMGADVALLAAAKDKRIKCLVAQGARADLEHHITKRFSEHELRELNMKKFITHPIHGTISRHFFDHLKRYNVLEELKEVSCPLLIIHGRNDFQVPWQDANQLYLHANEPKRLELVDNADHEFRDPEHREGFFEVMINWLNRWLKKVPHYDAETTEKMGRAGLR